MRTEIYCILSLILLAILSGLMYYNTVLVDTQAYVPSVYYLQGKELQDDDEERVKDSYAFKRPVEILLVTFLEPALGVRHGYSLLNLILLTLTTIVVYYYVRRLFAEKEQAALIGYISAILFATALPLILYATRVLIDVAGYLTVIVSLFAIDWVLKKEEAGEARWYHHGTVWLVLGFFLLVRDPVIILFPYYCFGVIWKCWEQNNPFKKRLLDCANILWPVIFAIIPELFFMWYFNVSFLLAGKSAAITAGKYSMLGWLKFLIVHLAAFHVAYFFALIGLKNEQEKKRKLFYMLYFFSALIYLVGIQLVALTSPRFSMILFPVVLSAAAYGIVIVAQKLHDTFPRLSVVAIILFLLVANAAFSFFGAWIYPANTLIPEDAGVLIVLEAVMKEVTIKGWWLF